MITVIVTFKISDELDADILKEKFIETSEVDPKSRTVFLMS